MLDPRIVQLAQAKNFATISFHLSSGKIATHVMWVDATDEHLLINTDVNRRKYPAIVENPNVTVMVWDKDDPYKYGEVRGTFVGEIRGTEADDDINALAQKYQGNDYSGALGSRVIMQIAPARQRTNGL